MSRLRVASFSISLDGFGSGIEQSFANPMGKGSEGLHAWAFKTETFQKMFGGEAGSRDKDNEFAARGFQNIGAWILGRNMFAHSRGDWTEDNWTGWWGDNPPYHTDVFILTHYPRAPIVMEGGTTFHFVTDGIHAALQRATAAAKGLDVRLGGGVYTLRQYLQAQLIDEMHIAISPILMGDGENLFANLNLVALGYHCVEHVPTSHATHIVIQKKI